MSQATPEDLAASNSALQAQLAFAKSELAHLRATTVPKVPQKPSVVKLKATKVGAAIVAAFTSTAAVRQEKNLAALIAVRLLISAGAADGLVKLVQAALSSAGW